MIHVLAQMVVLIAAGVVWRFVAPAGLDVERTRRTLTGLVYDVFLPALVLLVLWRAPLGLESARISLVAASGVLAAMVVSVLVCRVCGARRAASGALILAASFPNATYLGLPVLEASFGPWARSVAIQYDLFACTPLLLTVGMMVARRYGEGGIPVHPLQALLRIPALWAAALAVVLNLAAVPLHPIVAGSLDLMAGAVVPLMLLALGMSLRWDVLASRRLPLLLPVLLIQLLLMPLLAWAVAHGVGLGGDTFKAVVLEAAMPSMLLGVVICDRFRLDTGLYAAAVTLSTVLSLVTLPLWFSLLA